MVSRNLWITAAMIATLMAIVALLVGCNYTGTSPQIVSTGSNSNGQVTNLPKISEPTETVKPTTTEESLGGETTESNEPSLKPSSSKVLPPLEVGLTIEKEKLSVGRNYPLILTFTPLEDMYRADGQIETSGVISLTTTPDLEWKNLSAGEKVATRVTFGIEDLGEGEIRWIVQVMNEAGEVIYGRRTDLYFLVTEEEVLMGTDSPLLLKIEYLEKARKSGAITQKEYEEALEEILGGGAMEYNNSPSTSP